MRRTLLTLYLPSLLMAFGQGMVFPVVPLLATEFDVSPGLLGSFRKWAKSHR